ncbi:hypothetical protein Tco_0418199, partial [Tanacetum coccineum]
GIKEADFDLEEEIRLVENLSYDNSSPRPPKKINAEIADTIVESLSPSLIPVEDSDSRMEEIDLFLAFDELMSPGIKNDDYDSEGDIHFLEELLSNDPLPLPQNESSNFDHHDDPSFPRPPSEPPDVEVFFDFKPDTGVLTTKVVKGISEHYVLMPNILSTLPTLDPDLDFTPSHDSLGSGNKIFNLGIFIEKTLDGFQTARKKKKMGKSKSTNGGHFGGPSIKQTVRYEPKAIKTAPKKRDTNVGNIPMSNPYSALDEESDEDVENVYDESANLFQSKKIGGSSSTFTDAAS